MRMLVTGASTFFAARLIQGLGARGVDVTAADSHVWSVGKASRFAARRLRVPPLSRDPGGFLDTIVGELKSRPYDLLLPTFEEALLLAEFRERIEPLTRLLLPAFDDMWRLHHKPSLHELCLELDIPTPPTVAPATPAVLEREIEGLRFPVVLKLPAANNCLGRVFCASLDELKSRFQTACDQQKRAGGAAPFVQQRIGGDAIYSLLLCREGKKLGEVVYRPLRTYPDGEGTSAHRESIVHAEISGIASRLAAASRWSGFLGLDFLVDRVDGTPYLIDANPRATPAVQLGCLAGVDWPDMLIRLAQDKPVAFRAARPGVRNRTCLLDVGWLLEGLSPHPGWMQRAPRTLYRFVRPAWPLDSTHDYLGNGEWSCTLALTAQAIVAALQSVATGRALGDTILDGMNYDLQTVRATRRMQLRGHREIAGDVAELPHPLPAGA